MSKEAYYFSHDSNARNDPKVLRLLQLEGWEGYGLFWALVEMLRDAEGYRLETQYDVYAFALRVDKERIKSIVENYGLFVIDGVFFFSESLMRRMKLREEKSEKARYSANHRWEKQKENANALRTHCEGNAIKERKGKEIKVKEKIKITDKPIRPEWFSLSLWEVFLSNRKYKKLQNSKLALSKICANLKEAVDQGFLLEDCITEYVSGTWQKFEASWMQNKKKAQVSEWE